jgi:hypothetical protein
MEEVTALSPGRWRRSTAPATASSRSSQVSIANTGIMSHSFANGTSRGQGQDRSITEALLRLALFALSIQRAGPPPWRAPAKATRRSCRCRNNIRPGSRLSPLPARSGGYLPPCGRSDGAAAPLDLAKHTRRRGGFKELLRLQPNAKRCRLPSVGVLRSVSTTLARYDHGHHQTR